MIMNKTNNGIKPLVGTSKLVRAKFGPGMLLQHEDLELLNTYTRDLSRLMFKSFFGCGVICGLVVTADTKCDRITVGAGVALSCSGDPIWLPGDVTFDMNESCDSNPRKDYWVKLCGKISNCGPRTATCSSDEDETTYEWTRERLGYEISLVEQRPDGCGCGCPDPQTEKETRIGPDTPCKCVDPSQPKDPDPEQPYKRCYENHYAGECESGCGDCGDCACDCVWLAKVKWDEKESKWLVDHRPRRFIRPVLMRDPKVALEEAIRGGGVKEESMEPEVVQRAAARGVEGALADVAAKAVQREFAKHPEMLAQLKGAAVKALSKEIPTNLEIMDAAADVNQESIAKELLESIRDDVRNERLEAANRTAAMKAEIEEYREKLKALEANRPPEVSAFDAAAPVETAQPETAPTKSETKKTKATTKKNSGDTQ
jgi:hypothetical protein